MRRGAHGIAVHMRLLGAVCHWEINSLVVIVVTLETCSCRCGGSLNVLVRHSLWNSVLEKLEIVMMSDGRCWQS